MLGVVGRNGLANRHYCSSLQADLRLPEDGYSYEAKSKLGPRPSATECCLVDSWFRRSNEVELRRVASGAFVYGLDLSLVRSRLNEYREWLPASSSRMDMLSGVNGGGWSWHLILSSSAHLLFGPAYGWTRRIDTAPARLSDSNEAQRGQLRHC